MNFPPACSRVSTTSAAEMPSSSWMSTGMPRPLSRTVTLPSPFSVSSTREAKPACASSTALSMISNAMWCRPEPSSVSPIYMPGRLRTASSPLSTEIDAASYASPFVAPLEAPFPAPLEAALEAAESGGGAASSGMPAGNSGSCLDTLVI